MKFLRALGQLVIGVAAAVFVSAIAVQYARLIRHNLALTGAVQTTREQVGELRARRERELREIARLHDPQGAIPEIHDRLHLVRPGEAIIYLRKSP